MYYSKAMNAYNHKRFQLAEKYARYSLLYELELMSNDDIYKMFWIISESEKYKGMTV